MLIGLTTDTSAWASTAGESDPVAIRASVCVVPPGSSAKGDEGLVVGDDSLVHVSQIERHAAIHAVGSRPRRVAATLDGEGAVVRAATGTFGEGLDGEGDALGGERTEDTSGGQLSAGSPAVSPQLILVVVGKDDLVWILLADLVTLEVNRLARVSRG